MSSYKKPAQANPLFSKCGRVVCNSCSPHRIIIPYQYIVRAPGAEMNLPPFLEEGYGGSGYFDGNSLAGGERVRLCNPCVPDPNIAPPQGPSGQGQGQGQGTPGAVQSPSSPSVLSPRSSHQRSRSSIGDAYAAATSSSRYGMGMGIPSSHGADMFQPYGSRTRSMTVVCFHPRSALFPCLYTLSVIWSLTYSAEPEPCSPGRSTVAAETCRTERLLPVLVYGAVR